MLNGAGTRMLIRSEVAKLLRYFAKPWLDTHVWPPMRAPLGSAAFTTTLVRRRNVGFDRSCKLTPLSVLFPAASNKHKLLGTYSEENTQRSLFPRDFCTGKDLLPGTQTKYWGWVNCRSATTGGQMGGLISFECIIYFLSSTLPFLSQQTDVVYSSNTLFSLFPV